MQSEVTAPLIAINRHRLTTDGEGITTLVAFHGCSLRCKYCLNPQCLQSDGVWQATGGGICFGGGEPLLQSSFIKAFADIMNPAWKLTIETALNVPLKDVERVAPLIHTWYVDVKDLNSDIYKAYTGTENASVIRNLTWLAENGYADKVIIRLPLIPEYNVDSHRQVSEQALKNMGFHHFDHFTYTLAHLTSDIKQL